jgi:hypothetical protein
VLKRAYEGDLVAVWAESYQVSLLWVLLLDMVENSISPFERMSGGFSSHSTAQIGGVLHARDLSAYSCLHLHDIPSCRCTGPLHTAFTLNMSSCGTGDKG